MYIDYRVVHLNCFAYSVSTFNNYKLNLWKIHSLLKLPMASMKVVVELSI